MKVNAWVLTVVLGATGCGKQAAVPEKNTGNTPPGNPLTAPVDYLGAAGKAKKHIEKSLDTAGIKQAIQLFYASESRYPKDLQELVDEKYLPSLPTPPVGMKFQYDSKTGEFKVVSP